MAGIVVAGSINMDFVVRTPRIPAPGETIIGRTLTQVPGGKGANQAVAIARLGGDVTMIGRVGGDSFGQAMLSAMADSGVKLDGVSISEETSTGIAMISVDDAGENNIIVVPGANALVSPADFHRHTAFLQDASMLLMQLEIPLETVAYAASYAKERGITTFLNPAPAQPLSAELLNGLDFLLPNETELALLTGISGTAPASLERAANVLLSSGVRHVLVTVGANGSWCFGSGFRHHQPACPVTAIDTTAAGDSYAGAFVVALSEGKSIPEAMAFAARVSSITVSRNGAQSSLPFRAEVMQ